MIFKTMNYSIFHQLEDSPYLKGYVHEVVQYGRIMISFCRVADYNILTQCQDLLRFLIIIVQHLGSRLSET